jgi:hypothetical protein
MPVICTTRFDTYNSCKDWLKLHELVLQVLRQTDGQKDRQKYDIENVLIYRRYSVDIGFNNQFRVECMFNKFRDCCLNKT